MKASKVKDGGQNVCSYCREPYTHIKIVEQNSSRVASLEEFKRSTCGKCRGNFKNNSEICQLIVKNCTSSENVNCCDAKYHIHCITRMKDDTWTKESLKCMQCNTEFELVAKVNQNINNMQITQLFWNKWKHIENIDTEKECKKEQRTKIRYIKNNCLNIFKLVHFLEKYFVCSVVNINDQKNADKL